MTTCTNKRMFKKMEKSTSSICFCLIAPFKGEMSAMKAKTPRKIQKPKGKAKFGKRKVCGN